MFFVGLIFAACCAEVTAEKEFDINKYFDAIEEKIETSLGDRHIRERKAAGGQFVFGKAGKVIVGAYFHNKTAHTVFIRPGKGAKVVPENITFVEAGKWAVISVESEQEHGNKVFFQLQKEEKEEEKKEEEAPERPEQKHHRYHHGHHRRPHAKKVAEEAAKPEPLAESNSGSADKVISIAAGEIGYSRWNDPQAGTKYGRWYAKSHGSYFGTSGVPFCAMFVSWVFNQAGATCAGLPAAYCPYIVRDGKNAGKTVSKSNAKKGDVVLFDWSGCSDGTADHVGIVESNHASGSYMVCIEGNTDNGQVKRKTRSYSYILCIVRPYYDGSSGGSSSGGSSSGGSSSSGKLSVDGDLGPASIKAWQKALGTPVDGYVSGQEKSQKKYYPALTSVKYGSGGSSLVRAIQKKVGTTQDGILGPKTVKGIQKKVGTTQDGVLGSNTAKAIQKSLNSGKW